MNLSHYVWKWAEWKKIDLVIGASKFGLEKGSRVVFSPFII